MADRTVAVSAIEPSVRIRGARGRDQAFVAATWAFSLRDAGWRRSKANEIVDRLLDDPACRLLCACDPEEPDRLVGWIAAATLPAARLLLYAYVRDKHRRGGIGSLLLRSAFADASKPLYHVLRGPDADALLTKYQSKELPVETFLGGVQ